MPRGGYRPGAGRKPGGLSAKTRETVERALTEGITPLEVMLDNMRFYHHGAGELVAELLGGDMPVVEAEAGEDPASLSIIQGITQVLGLRKMAGEEAARAAPYCHPRQGYAGEDGGQGDEEMPLAERLKEYQRRDDLKAAGSNVIDYTARKDT